jgi:hypothetical protein
MQVEIDVVLLTVFSIGKFGTLWALFAFLHNVNFELKFIVEELQPMCCKCSHGHVMNACRHFYFVPGTIQAKKDNNN